MGWIIVIIQLGIIIGLLNDGIDQITTAFDKIGGKNEEE